MNIGGLYRFRSGVRVVMSEPTMNEGQLKVEVAMPFIRFTDPCTVKVNTEGEAYAYPGRAFLPISLLCNELEIYGPVVDGFRQYRQKFIKDLPLVRKRPSRNKRRSKKK